MAERLSCNELLRKKFNQEQENRRLRVQFPLRAYISGVKPLGNLKGFQPDLQNLSMHFGN